MQYLFWAFLMASAIAISLHMLRVSYRLEAMGTIVKMARQNLGLSLREMGRRTGVSYQQIKNIEAGSFGTTISTFCHICRGLGIPPGLLLEDSLFVSAASFQETLAVDKHWAELLAHGQIRAGAERETAGFLMASCCALVEHLLSISGPVRFEKRVRYPVPGMRAAYAALARKIEDHFTHKGRLAMLDRLHGAPCQLIVKEKLCNVKQLREYHRSLPHLPLKGTLWERLCSISDQGSATDGWYPFFNQDILRILEPVLRNEAERMKTDA
jgi:transcriptional regulator with XRE-family HTH domain